MGRTLLLRLLLCAVLSGFVAAAPAAWVPLRLADETPKGESAPERRVAMSAPAAAFKAEERPRARASGRDDAPASAQTAARRGADRDLGAAPGPSAAPTPPLALSWPHAAAQDITDSPLSAGRAPPRADLRAGLVSLPPPLRRA